MCVALFAIRQRSCQAPFFPLSEPSAGAPWRPTPRRTWPWQSASPAARTPPAGRSRSLRPTPARTRRGPAPRQGGGGGEASGSRRGSRRRRRRPRRRLRRQGPTTPWACGCSGGAACHWHSWALPLLLVSIRSGCCKRNSEPNAEQQARQEKKGIFCKVHT